MAETETHDPGTVTGLTAGEAKEFHKAFVGSTLGFTLIAVVAHLLVWFWRPWIPGPGGYDDVSALEGTTQLAEAVTRLFG